MHCIVCVRVCVWFVCATPALASALPCHPASCCLRQSALDRPLSSQPHCHAPHPDPSCLSCLACLLWSATLPLPATTTLHPSRRPPTIHSRSNPSHRIASRCPLASTTSSSQFFHPDHHPPLNPQPSNCRRIWLHRARIQSRSRRIALHCIACPIPPTVPVSYPRR